MLPAGRGGFTPRGRGGRGRGGGGGRGFRGGGRGQFCARITFELKKAYFTQYLAVFIC